MKLALQITLICLTSILWFDYISCGMEEWTCLCASSDIGKASYALEANCSTACDCRPDVVGGTNGEKWACLCADKRGPQILSSIHNANCFTACNCTSGFSGASKAEKKHISSKLVVYILLVCVVLTTVAFIASVTCYIHRKDKFPRKLPLFSSDKESSCNSTTNLISYRSTTTPEFQVNLNSQVNPIMGCIHKASLMFGSKKQMIHMGLLQFSYIELEQATDKFSKSNLIGLGGSSNVYRGHLKDGKIVAVKRLKMKVGPSADSEFLTEIELISRLHHCHVVPLLGYCSEIQGKLAERLLVFEFMPNGNLRDCLDGTQGKEPIDWVTRVGIAIGAARGLEYLHEAAAPRILHRDVKSTNILLDDKWKAKITDLGMAKRFTADDLPSCSNSPARMQGTFGYFAPEYAIVGKASLKSDVFSYGVVLLELVSGRQPINRSSRKGEESLVMWATPRLTDSKRIVSELVDPLLKGNFQEEEVYIMAYLARECLQMDPESRPTMSEIVQILSTISPDRSKRQRFPINFFQSPINRSLKSAAEVGIEGAEDQHNRDELGRAASERWPDRLSLPLSVDRNLCNDAREQANTSLSTEDIQRLILLTSKGRSWRAPDDEFVDLTEPRFESFLEVNIRSP